MAPRYDIYLLYKRVAGFWAQGKTPISMARPGAQRALLGPYRAPIGPLLGPYWAPIGPLLGPYRAPIGPLLGPYWVPIETCNISVKWPYLDTLRVSGGVNTTKMTGSSSRIDPDWSQGCGSSILMVNHQFNKSK